MGREKETERAKEGLHLDPPVKKSGAADPLRRLGEQLRRLLLLLRREPQPLIRLAQCPFVLLCDCRRPRLRPPLVFRHHILRQWRAENARHARSAGE